MNEEPIGFRELTSSATVRVALTGTLAILALFLLAETISIVSGLITPTMPPAHTITVTGEGKATAMPDIATVDFSVQETAKQVTDAQTAATARANKALGAVKQAGVADKDVRTLSYNVSPQYSYPTPCPQGALCPSIFGNAPTITGYQVSETVEVKVRDLAKVGGILESLGTLGVQNVSGPSFAVDDPSAVTAMARAQAINKAKTDAARLAEELGVSLGRIVNFSENTAAPYPLYSASVSSARGAAVAPTLPTGENEYDANVSVTYEIR